MGEQADQKRTIRAQALSIALAAWEHYERIGSPEGELAIAEAVVYLAIAPKSNAVYKGFAAAIEDVRRTHAEPVPLHLRNAPTALMKAEGYGAGYRYAHDDPAAREEMPCLPPSLVGRRYLGSGGRSRGGQTDGPKAESGE